MDIKVLPFKKKFSLKFPFWEGEEGKAFNAINRQE